MFRASLKVVPLFLILVDLALNSINKRWDHISVKMDIFKNEFIIAVSFILDSIFFAFNNKTYKQIFTPMDLSLSLIIADSVMQDLKEIAINKLLIQHCFILNLHVDDVILALPSNTINNTLNTFNSLHTKLQFTRGWYR